MHLHILLYINLLIHPVTLSHDHTQFLQEWHWEFITVFNCQTRSAHTSAPTVQATSYAASEPVSLHSAPM